ncbi:zinc ribbon domain-containing protein [Novosphingobium sp. 1949]|uniref:Zinc ribbon domain-containing protein n=1 Tax=Novosphingobium organovorum TaxID=2930092 RepID=A0ABT0BEK8_9SPHN|nr:zinc ribbon domain-containing protein [Novosphingobium organovorum]MCJ2183516.1 zinc ribbon domain-containing protein [Novosphingobium organovorum]
MPLYDFHCTHCAAEFELLMRHDDTPVCPQCGSSALNRMVSRVSPPGKSKAIIAAGRERARREGHLSNF